MTCRICEEHGEPMYCNDCGWRGYQAGTRTKEQQYVGRAQPDVHFICPECNDEHDLANLELVELTEVYGEECSSCPQDGDVHVYPFGTVLEAPGVQPEHDLRGVGCWCTPDVARCSADGARVVIHRAVEVS